ncbi:MAG: hypothetical protein LAP21_12710 [Acidobacteriia bacterium]|nr:hypothetical protein [Terriglobia bacterium]
MMDSGLSCLDIMRRNEKVKDQGHHPDPSEGLKKLVLALGYGFAIRAAIAFALAFIFASGGAAAFALAGILSFASVLFDLGLGRLFARLFFGHLVATGLGHSARGAGDEACHGCAHQQCSHGFRHVLSPWGLSKTPGM